jgi:hypothetical protein
VVEGWGQGGGSFGGFKKYVNCLLVASALPPRTTTKVVCLAGWVAFDTKKNFDWLFAGYQKLRRGQGPDERGLGSYKAGVRLVNATLHLAMSVAVLLVRGCRMPYAIAPAHRATSTRPVQHRCDNILRRHIATNMTRARGR